MVHRSRDDSGFLRQGREPRFARGDASEATRSALADRVRFDAENSSGYIKALSAEILQELS